jgi:hypothetical protein
MTPVGGCGRRAAREDDMKFSDLVSITVAAAFAAATGAVPAAAGNNKVKPVKPAAAAKAKPAKAPKASTPAKTNVKAAKPNSSAKPKAAGSSKPLTSANQAAASNKPAPGNTKNAKGDTGPFSSANGDGRPEPTSPALPSSKAQEKLASNAKLRAKMQSRLPRGVDVMSAAGGFKNLGQFVAAVNVSRNLGIEFNTLKRWMVGQGYSLGQAIQQAKAMDAGRATSLANAAVIEANNEIANANGNTLTTSRKVKDKS